MIPGEIVYRTDSSGARVNITINPGATVTTLEVYNVADRPVSVASHLRFDQANGELRFDRDKAAGKTLDLPAGEMLRVEPGQSLSVRLVPFPNKQG